MNMEIHRFNHRRGRTKNDVFVSCTIDWLKFRNCFFHNTKGWFSMPTFLGKSCTLCILSFTSHVQDIQSETSSRLRGGEDMGISESLPRIIDSNNVKPNFESVLITHKRGRFTDTLNHPKMGRTYNALEWLDRLLIKDKLFSCWVLSIREQVSSSDSLFQAHSLASVLVMGGWSFSSNLIVP
jgi:hypothetical protein